MGEDRIEKEDEDTEGQRLMRKVADTEEEAEDTEGHRHHRLSDEEEDDTEGQRFSRK
jgi:hypothetical protein